MILSVTKGSVQMKIGERTLTIGGEALLPMPGEPDYVVSLYDITCWDPPFESIEISTEEKKKILNIFVDEMLKERKMVVEIE